MAGIAKILKQGLRGLRDKARKVPSISVPDFLVRLIAIFDPVARGRLYELGKPRQVSSEDARRLLGWTTRSVPENILDTARSVQVRVWFRLSTFPGARPMHAHPDGRRAFCHLPS
jgi:dihydroflavonol-4-reductase